MSYKDKKLREKMFQDSLKELLVFAYASPILSLKHRRALVEAISKGGSLGNPYKKDRAQLPYALNYQYTCQGLLRVCSGKMISHPETARNLRKAICIISALSAWVKTNPNRTADIFNDFASEMCPEDTLQNPALPITDVISRNFHKELKKESGEVLGGEKALDFITDSATLFYKKYTRM